MEETLVPLDGLARFLDERVGASAGPIEVVRLGEGHSNLTFVVRRGDREWVLRRPPRGEILPSTHEMPREFTVMHALRRSGAPVPVPETLALCEDASYIGAPFYLMGYVDGIVIRGAIPEVFAGRHREVGFELVDVLAAIHAVDWRTAGLESMARKPERFLERNLERMQQLYEMVRSRKLEDLEAAGDWLRAHAPDQRDVTLTHGDYKLDNVMFAPDLPPRINAVVDWEVSTIGDPMVDVGWMLYFSQDPSDDASAALGAVGAAGTSGRGYPTRAELAARYVERSGRGLSDLPFYAAFAGWKIAIIMEGSYRRFQQGTADDPMFAGLDAGVRALARRAMDIIRGDARVI